MRPRNCEDSTRPSGSARARSGAEGLVWSGLERTGAPSQQPGSDSAPFPGSPWAGSLQAGGRPRRRPARFARVEQDPPQPGHATFPDARTAAETRAGAPRRGAVLGATSRGCGGRTRLGSVWTSSPILGKKPLFPTPAWGPVEAQATTCGAPGSERGGSGSRVRLQGPRELRRQEGSPGLRRGNARDSGCACSSGRDTAVPTEQVRPTTTTRSPRG